MNRAHGCRGVQHRWRSMVAGLSIMLAASQLYAQKPGSDPSLYAFKDGPAFFTGRSNQPVHADSEGTLVTPSALPESPLRNQPAIPVFDSLRLTSSDSLDDDQETQQPMKLPKFTIDADAVSALHKAVRVPS